MNLLFVIKTMQASGGAERVLAEVTGELAERGHRVTLLSFDPQSSPDAYQVDGRVHRIWLNAGRTQSHTSASDLLKRILALRISIKKIDPDIAVGFMHSAYTPLAIASVGTGVPVVGSEHCVYQHFASRTADKVALFVSSALCDRITVVSKRAKSGFPRRLRQSMIVIPNPVAPNALITRQSDRRQVILSVGRLVKEKDQQTLIAAFARIAGDFPEWRLRIVGEGELRSILEKQVRDLGVADRVELPGSTPEIWREYSEAQIFASASKYESFGLAIAEALAAGLPVIGFAESDGANELIRPGVNGLLADGSDRVAGMAAALTQLISADEKRRSMSATGPVSIEFLSVEKIADQWEQLFDQVRRSRR